MFMILKTEPIDSMATLNNAKGSSGTLCRDSTTGDVYVKRSSGWVKILSGGTIPVDALGSVTVKNSAGTVTRTLTETSPGVVALAATDAIVANGDSLTLVKSTGAAATGTATLNSPAAANVASGVVSNVKASA